MTDLRQSEKYGRYMEKMGWVVERHSDDIHRWQIFIRKIPLLGSVVKFQRPEPPISFEWVLEIAKKYRSLFVKIEPDISVISSGSEESRAGLQGPTGSFTSVQDDMLERGYTLDNWPLIPTKTIVIDISPAPDEILEKMEKDTRYCIRKALGSALRVEVVNNSEESSPRQIGGSNNTTAIELFIKLWHENAKRKGFWIPMGGEILSLWKSFGKDAYLITASREGLTNATDNRGRLGQSQVLASGLFLRNEGTLHYMHAGTTLRGRELLAPYLVIWEGIKLGKSLGCGFLDLEGVYDERYKKLTKKWHGFTHFKKGFGGVEVSYTGSFIKCRNSLLQLLFKIGV